MPPQKSSSRPPLNSAVFGYGIATLAFFVFIFVALFLWGDFTEGVRNGFPDGMHTVLVETALALACIAFWIVGIKMTMPVSDFFLGMVYLPLGILFAGSYYYVYLFAPDVNATMTSSARATPLTLGIFLIFLGIGKLIGGSVNNIDRTALSAPQSGSWIKSLVDFIELFVLAVVITCGSVALLAYGMLFLIRL